MVSPKLVLFDLDDTLIPSEAIYVECLDHLKVDQERFLEARGQVKKRLGPGHTSARNRLLYFKDYFSLQGGLNPSQPLSLMADYERLLADRCAHYWTKLNRPALFEQLAQKSTLGIVTNENLRTQMIKLRAIDPEGRYFSFLVTSEEVGAEKPAPRIWQEALAINNTDPRECVMVGDSVTADIETPRQLGMRSILTQEFISGIVAQDCSFETIDKLDELPDRLL